MLLIRARVATFAAVLVIGLAGLVNVAAAQSAPELAYYKFDEGSGATTSNHADPGAGFSQAQFNNGLVPVQPGWTSSPIGQSAVSVNGNQFLNTGIDPALLNNTDWTIEFWIRSNAIGARQSVLSDGGNFGIYLFNQTGNLIVYDNNSNSLAWSGVDVITGEWMHVAFVYNNSTETLDAYVNGWPAFEDQPFSHGFSSGNFELFRGGYTLNLQGATQPIANYTQMLDEFRFWMHARTADQIRYYSGIQGPYEDGLVAWRLDEPTMSPVLPLGPASDFVFGGSMSVLAQQAQSVSEFVVSNAGTAEQGVEVRLHAGASVPFHPPTMPAIGSGILENGQAVIEINPPLQLDHAQVMYLYVTYRWHASATGGETFGVQLADENAFTLTSGQTYSANQPLPFEWTMSTLFGTHLGLPAFTDFAQPPTNFVFRTGQGVYPMAQQAGGAVSLAPGPSTQARVRIGNPSNQQPVSAEGMAGIDFPQGTAVGALDFHYDLSQYNLAITPVHLHFYWNQLGLAPDEASHVFISVDGGASWLTSLYEFPLPHGPEWRSVGVSISQALLQQGVDLNGLDAVVIRFQTRGSGAFNQAGLLLDNVGLAVGSHLRLSRVGYGTTPDGATDDWGAIAGPGQTQMQYAIENVGVGPLEVFSAQARNASGATLESIQVGLATPLVLAPGEIRVFPVTVALDGTGPIEFDLEFQATDPLLSEGIYRSHVIANGANLAPTIRPASWVSKVYGNAEDGFVYAVLAGNPLGHVVLVVEDANGDAIEVVRIDGAAIGVVAPQPAPATQGPIELTWTGIAHPAGRHKYTIVVTDGSLTTTTTLELLFNSPVRDSVDSIACAASATGRANATLLLPLALLLLVLSCAARMARRTAHS